MTLLATFGKPFSCADRRFSSPGPLNVTATLKKLTFSFFQFTENKMSMFKTHMAALPVRLCPTWLKLCISIVIIKSHNFQNPFYEIFDDFLILARLIPSGALACSLDHARTWLRLREPFLHPAQILPLGDIDSAQNDSGLFKTDFFHFFNYFFLRGHFASTLWPTFFVHWRTELL